MEILSKYGKEDLATLYVAKIDNNIVEFVESIQPPIPREKKWVLIISTLFGCPMQCVMCDAGEYYEGKISKEGLFEQIDFMLLNRYPDKKVPAEKFKIQFARIGEPTLNEAVLEVLRELPNTYDAPGLIPCISTIAPRSAENFLDELLKIKNELYAKGYFQLQFSIHSTDEEERKKWLPKNIWNFEEIQNYGNKWYRQGDKKITLNFAISPESIVDPTIIKQYFDPQKYFIKITPVNPTNSAIQNKLDTGKDISKLVLLEKEFQKEGYQTLISIGELEENLIGTNCGQFATKFNNGTVSLKANYSSSKYKIEL